MNLTRMSRISLLIFTGLIISLTNFAYNLRKIEHNSISGSVIHSIFQDKKGLIWIGTSNGLSSFNEKSTSLFLELKGKSVKKIWEGSEDVFWVETIFGLHKINPKSNSVITFDLFDHISCFAADSSKNIFLIQENHIIYYYSNKLRKFDNVYIPNLIANEISIFFIDPYNQLWIGSNDGVLRRFKISQNAEGYITVQEKLALKHENGLSFSFADKKDVYFIDNKNLLYLFSYRNESFEFISDLSSLFNRKSKLTSAVKFYNEFYFGFSEDGLFKFTQNKTFEKIPLNSGVSFLYNDNNQPIIWIGTNGKGTYTFSLDSYTIRSVKFNDFSFKINKPVRAVYYDSDQFLWIGTEGNGIMRIKKFNPYLNITNEEVDFFNTSNGLCDNLVYSFQENSKGLWIGTESGLHFYSKTDHKIRKINFFYKSIDINKIRSVFEKDSFLWITCYGLGVIKATVYYVGNTPSIKQVELFQLQNGDKSSNRFLSIFSASDGFLAFGNHGKGMAQLFSDSILKSYGLSVKSQNYVNSLSKNQKGEFLVATPNGLVKYLSYNKSINKGSVIFQGNIKSIIYLDENSYWLSTDDGLVFYNPDSEVYRIYNQLNGLNVTEYVENSYFKDLNNEMLFFGGVDGFTSVSRSFYDKSMDYMPSLYLDKLFLYGNLMNIHEYLINKNKQVVLKLKHNQNYFSLSFDALDYINGYNYLYYYKINSSNYWIQNGNSGSISFTDLAPGEYDLSIKYFNKVLNKESYIYNLKIIVLPPWYLTKIAFLIYILLFMAMCFIVVRWILMHNRRKRLDMLSRLDQQHKEDVYEAKLQFFTHIAHEFCTPLTLIYGPCNRILKTKHLNESVLKYTEIIQQNANRLNLLIQDLMDFKQIESDYKKPEIVSIPVSDLTNAIIDSFNISADEDHIKVTKILPQNLFWNTDENFLTTILFNLLSNAFKYVSSSGEVNIQISVVDNILLLCISNTGVGIKREDLDLIFNRFSILDDFEMKTDSIWSRNGLGLAISNGMAKLLGGSIKVESIPNSITKFIVSLPHIPKEDVKQISLKQFKIPEIQREQKNIYLPKRLPRDLTKPTLLVVDDEIEIRWLIYDIFLDDFNVIALQNANEAIDFLKEEHPDVIICDIQMKGLDGISLTKEIKANTQTAHIPLIILSAYHEIEKKIEAVDAGAEKYITKPFEVEYLITSVRQLIDRKKTLKEYFSSPLSAFELSMGKLTHLENKKFIRKIYTIIHKNIRNKDLSIREIAKELNISSRTLYRKIKDIENFSIPQMIHDCRLRIATDLLLKSKLTIDEIIYKSGFSNRAVFYRTFSSKYNCTPSEYKKRMKVNEN